jgi:hypothetical protein
MPGADNVPQQGGTSAAGTETDPEVMKAVAAEAEDIVDRLMTVANRLDDAMSGLGGMDGAIKLPFWQGHNNHLEAMGLLRTKLHNMANGIVTSKAAYENADANGQQSFRQLAGHSGGGFAGGGTGPHVIETSYL